MRAEGNGSDPADEIPGLGLTQKLIHIFHWTNGVVPVLSLGVML